MILSFIILGLIAGTFSGLFGIGGGLIVVPGLALIFAHFGMPQHAIMHLAVGTSLSAMIATTLSSGIAHLQKGIQPWPSYKKLVLGVALGAIVGSIVAHMLETRVIEILFGLFLVGVAAQMFIVSFFSRMNTQTDQPEKHQVQSKYHAAGLLIGLKSGILGVGGGALSVPFLLHCRVNIREAMAASTLCGFTIAIIGTIMFAILGSRVISITHTVGYIYWPATITVGVASIFAARFGVWLSYRTPVKHLKLYFAVLLLTIAVKMLFF